MSVEKVFPDGFDHLGDADDIHIAALVIDKEVVGKEGDAPDMVKVRMGDKNISYLLLGASVQHIGQASRIKEDLIVKEKPGGVVAGELCA